MNVGDLTVDLSFNDKGMVVTTRRAGEVVSQLTRDLNRGATAAEKMEHAHHSLGRTFRNFMITVASIRFALMDFNQVILGIPRNVMRVSGELERMMKPVARWRRPRASTTSSAWRRTRRSRSAR
jgi:hypothetical protein